MSAIERLPLRVVQLDLSPLVKGEWDERRTYRLLQEAGIGIRSGMLAFEHEDYTTLDSIRRTGGLAPDEHWPRCKADLRDAAEVAERFGLRLVTMHAGHLPQVTPGDAIEHAILERLDEACRVFASRGVRLGLETGQESAATLEVYLEALRGVEVNFDPANMILYGMGDPHEALQRLSPRVAQIHIKDAKPASVHGEWGTEVVAGTGEVDWPRLLDIARRHCPDAPLIIERESGEERAHDIAVAASLLVSVIDGAAP